MEICGTIGAASRISIYIIGHLPNGLVGNGRPFYGNSHYAAGLHEAAAFWIGDAEAGLLRAWSYRAGANSRRSPCMIARRWPRASQLPKRAKYFLRSIYP